MSRPKHGRSATRQGALETKGECAGADGARGKGAALTMRSQQEEERREQEEFVG